MKTLPFGFSKAEDSPGFLLWQTTMIWQRLIKKMLEKYGISHAQFVIMATLLWFELHNHDTTQVLIIHWSKLDKMTVSKSLKQLVALELVHRIMHKTDSRAKQVSLTTKGKALIRELIPMVEQIDTDFFGKLPSQDEKSLIRILGQLTTK